MPGVVWHFRHYMSSQLSISSALEEQRLVSQWSCVIPATPYRCHSHCKVPWMTPGFRELTHALGLLICILDPWVPMMVCQGRHDVCPVDKNLFLSKCVLLTAWYSDLLKVFQQVKCFPLMPTKRYAIPLFVHSTVNTCWQPLGPETFGCLCSLQGEDLGPGNPGIPECLLGQRGLWGCFPKQPQENQANITVEETREAGWMLVVKM